MSPPSSGRSVPPAPPRFALRLLRTSLLALFLSGGAAVLLSLLLPWLASGGGWHGELFAVGGLVTLLCPVLGVVLEASLAEPDEDTRT